MNERDRTYLSHIRDCIRTIREYTAPGKDAFLASRMCQDAVFRNFEIIGEAGSRLSSEVRSCGAVPWADIKAFRNFLIHQYTDIRPSLVWKVIEEDMPALETHVLALLAEE
ncbi:DUF86 domain-containing protein [Magnetospirillum sp. UT-4]|uniref:HepT-like ribonuclease domain-containing protein n=1 Tax=Magnetospirillum sp. UT-4 TaxID=2681467 RepID=UPI0013844FAB|nr:HepT-like ribonuclease domain-containing protein [Magnetospirillum sp. UT-4]CAA7626921.1 conserved hypothetical protein [Magnetospirillum sp. UT-4]